MDDINRFVTLQRENDDTPDQGTPGVMTCDTGTQFYSLEAPDRNNEPDFSRIPAGTYLCELEESYQFHERDGTRAMLYHVQDVPGRTAVKMHWGNFAGDVRKGWLSSVKGCVLQGTQRGVLKGQKAVLDTNNGVHQFIEEMNREPFKLIVKDAQ